jgi:hypothetical protein
VLSREIQDRVRELLPDPVPPATEAVTGTFPAVTGAFPAVTEPGQAGGSQQASATKELGQASANHETSASQQPGRTSAG